MQNLKLAGVTSIAMLMLSACIVAPEDGGRYRHHDDGNNAPYGWDRDHNQGAYPDRGHDDHDWHDNDDRYDHR